MLHFWAKISQDGTPGLSVYDHMRNVGHVARSFVENMPQLLTRFQLQSTAIACLAALHDLGKIAPGFQRKCPAWLTENGLENIARNGCWDTTMESDHGKVSHAAIQTFLLESGMNRRSAKFLAAVLGGHHGRLNPPSDRGYQPQRLITESESHIDWDTERLSAARMVCQQLGGSEISAPLDDNTPSLWWLAGLTTVADWIGSDERFFPPEKQTGNEDVVSLARIALQTIGFLPLKVQGNLSFQDLFGFAPNEMQDKALANIISPGVYVIEAPMGMGKTEAALGAAYNLLAARKANGIYFALPTQATSNRMFLRMNAFLKRIVPDSPSSRLVHGNSWLMAANAGIEPTKTDREAKATDDARTARDWFASPKRALLAPFGVGTVDQALLGVVASKHFFVRHFALAGKVVILDEIHSYDLYTGTLIDQLITTLEGLGCTLIVLSATLTGRRRGQLVSPTDDSENDSEQPYPLITGRMEGMDLTPVKSAPPESRTVEVNFVTSENATTEAIALAWRGGTVLWICNTVDAAQKQYQHFAGLAEAGIQVGLLHSRFPFWRREALETEWMERLGKDSKTRCGSILIATQVVEQSVDLDADLLITELAPTDMLLQRLGRLWRHERGKRPIDTPRLLILEEIGGLDSLRALNPKVIVACLGSKAKVYAPFILLRSLEVWKGQQQISVPGQIRWLIESTYKEREKEPESWQQLANEWFGTDSAKKMLAMRNTNLWQVALEDEEGVQTRLNEMPTVSLVLCREITRKEALFLDQSRELLEGEEYRLATARAIHKNLVKIPKYCFSTLESHRAFAEYLHGDQCVGVVQEDGTVTVQGLQQGTRMRYTDEQGLFIEKTNQKEEV